MLSDKICKMIEERFEHMLAAIEGNDVVRDNASVEGNVFAEHIVSIECKRAEIETGLAGCSEKEAQAVKYLYASMPLSDCVNYRFIDFLDYARHGIYLEENGEWKNRIPEELFLNYVMHYRINGEDISPCRSFFYKELKESIKGLSMKEAALKVNYWCAGEATYQSTDDRTVSPMTVYHSAFGRCGEESAFTVSALRSVGLPARQVYVPRWSHCDDNHAWVEVWCDGEWYFMGACEPEEVLNKGWFPGAASRAMLIHSRTFFPLESKDSDLIGMDGAVYMYNETSRYAKTKKIRVLVQTENKTPVVGADVDFEVLNYAEYCLVASVKTDTRGEASIVLGMGSIHIHTFYKDASACLTVAILKDEQVVLTLKKNEDAVSDTWLEFDMNAPPDAIVHPGKITSLNKTEGLKKLQNMTEHRLKKTEVWNVSAKESALCYSSDTQDKIEEIFSMARGNLLEIEKFLANQSGDRPEIKKKLLYVLTAKDYRDLKAEVLLEHYEGALVYADVFEEAVFVNYVLNPRIALEPLSSYRSLIEAYFDMAEKEQFRKEPASLWKRLSETVEEYPKMEYEALITLPASCLLTGIGSRNSKKILCIAILRTLGVPARFSGTDNSMEYYAKGKWEKICKEEAPSAILRLESEKDIHFIYQQNFTLAKLSKGRYKTLQMLNTDWENLFLTPGRYRILTANRLPNGNLFAQEYNFTLQKSEEKNILLILRSAELSDMLEKIKLPNFVFQDTYGTDLTLKDTLKEGKHVLIWLEEGKEPTEHILNELYEKQNEFNNLSSRLLLFIRSTDALKNTTIMKTLPVLRNKQIYYDSFQENVNLLGRRMYVDPDKLPLIIVVENGNGIYAQSGYNVGTADMLLRILRNK